MDPRPPPPLSVPSGQHICLLYREDDERTLELSRFLAAGRREQHKLLYIVDERAPSVVRRRYAELGVDLDPSTGAQVLTTVEAYYPDGRFDPDAMLAGLDAFSEEAVREGFAGCRCTGEMGWAARRVPGAERLIEYEARLTGVIERHRFSGICQYDVRLFDGPTLLAVLEVHPFLLVRGQVIRNPNHVRGRVPAAPGRDAHEQLRV